MRSGATRLRRERYGDDFYSLLMISNGKTGWRSTGV